jgi:2,3-bisphosphoglycerate-independent phosphoglycerate mutase
MKYVVLIGDGMGDYPLKELDGRTPLQEAETPNMDYLAENGACGLVKTIPDEMEAGSDIANLSILGYDPRKFYTGRGPLEAAAIGVQLGENDVAYRCNLITEEGGVIKDHSAGHISSKESRILIDHLAEKTGDEIFAGVSYRHILIKRESEVIPCYPPHDILSKPIMEHLPESPLRELILKSKEILKNHPINRERREQGKPPANMIWLWGGGKPPKLPPFRKKYGVGGAVVAGVDLIKGIGKHAGFDVLKVPGATGYLDTDYEAKAAYGLKALQEKDFLLLHVEAIDEASHLGDVSLKIKAIEDFDSKIVGPFIDKDMKILLLTDHYTPISKRTHTREPSPFVISGYERDEIKRYDEFAEGKYGILPAEKLMHLLIR